jgi:hypothetical protein
MIEFEQNIEPIPVNNRKQRLTDPHRGNLLKSIVNGKAKAHKKNIIQGIRLSPPLSNLALNSKQPNR